MKVWDAPVRLLHWLLVAAVALSAAALADWGLGRAHQLAGYVALAAVALRVAWGFTGGGHARFSSFVRAPVPTAAYLRALLRGREPAHIGHNPLGGWMIVALLACVAALALTGWLYRSDWLWGDETVETVHRSLAWLLLALATLHVAGVAYASWRQRENLVLAMVTGRKRGADCSPGG